MKIQGADVAIKSIYVQDRTGKAKVTLWRDASNSEVRPGDFVEITDIISNTWKKETAVSTTSRSTVFVCICS